MSISRRDFLKMAGSSAAAFALFSKMEHMRVLAQDTTITFGGWGGVAEDEGVKEAIQVFMAEHPEIAVEWQHTPDAGEYGRILLTNYAAGTAPDASFIIADDYETLAVSGALLDLTDLIENDPLLGQEDYFIQPQESNRSMVNGRWYGIGSTWVAHHIYYNADILEEAGVTPPGFQDDEIWDWDQFLEVCKQLTKDSAGRHPDDAGFDPDDIQQYAIDWPMGWWMPLTAAVFSNGGQFFNEDGLLALDSPEAMEAMQRVADLTFVHHVAPRSSSMESLGMNNTQMIDTGRLAMGIDGSWALAWMNPSMLNVNMGTGALPKMVKPATTLQAHFHAVLSSTQHPEEAWEWVRFLATPFYQEHFAKIGLWTPNQSAMLTEEGLQGWITEGIHPDNYSEWATDYLPKHGVAVSLPPGWIEANNDYIQPAIDAIANGEQAVDVFPAAVASANEVLLAMKESM
jgi:multiple sugar transport system substrate-binding protein